MKIWVGVTDDDWFARLSHVRPDEVNFWQPSGSRTFRALQPGELFLFKLHSPKNFIVGGGRFVSYSALPASLAWDAFGVKNGVASFDELRSRIRRYRRKDNAIDPVIGCNVLAEPFFRSRRAGRPILCRERLTTRNLVKVARCGNPFSLPRRHTVRWRNLRSWKTSQTKIGLEQST